MGVVGGDGNGVRGSGRFISCDDGRGVCPLAGAAGVFWRSDDDETIGRMMPGIFAPFSPESGFVVDFAVPDSRSLCCFISSVLSSSSEGAVGFAMIDASISRLAGMGTRLTTGWMVRVG
jgi:hypothetical protein